MNIYCKLYEYHNIMLRSMCLMKFLHIHFWSSWAPPLGARRCHGAVKRCPWAAPNVAPRPRRHAAPWRRHHRRPGLEAPPADRPREKNHENITKTHQSHQSQRQSHHQNLSKISDLFPSPSIYFQMQLSAYFNILLCSLRIHIKMASKLF